MDMQGSLSAGEEQGQGRMTLREVAFEVDPEGWVRELCQGA